LDSGLHLKAVARDEGAILALVTIAGQIFYTLSLKVQVLKLSAKRSRIELANFKAPTNVEKG